MKPARPRKRRRSTAAAASKQRRRRPPAPATRARGRARVPRAASRAARAAARPSPDGTVTFAEYARSRGLSRQAVSRAAREGRIPVASRGRVDPAAADAAWRANTDPGRPSSSLPGGADAPATPASSGAVAAAIAAAVAAGTMELPETLSLNDARAVREWNQAVKIFVERRRLTDELVEAKKVEDAAFRAARTVRDKLMALPDRLDATLAATSDVAEVRRLIEEEVRRICEEFATALMQDPDSDEGAGPEAAAS